MKQSTVERKAKEIYVNTFGMIPDDRDLQPFLEMAQWSEQQALRKVMEMIESMKHDIAPMPERPLSEYELNTYHKERMKYEKYNQTIGEVLSTLMNEL